MKKDAFDGLVPNTPELKLSDDKLQAMIAKAVAEPQEEQIVVEHHLLRKFSYSAIAMSCAALLYVCSVGPLAGQNQQQMVEESFEDIYDYETIEFLDEMV